MKSEHQLIYYYANITFAGMSRFTWTSYAVADYFQSKLAVCLTYVKKDEQWKSHWLFYCCWITWKTCAFRRHQWWLETNKQEWVNYWCLCYHTSIWRGVSSRVSSKSVVRPSNLSNMKYIIVLNPANVVICCFIFNNYYTLTRD